MAGDEYYLQVRNDKKDILDDLYLGKLRYNNMFVLSNWKYECSNNPNHRDYYNLEERKEDNQIRYNIWNDTIIEDIRNVYNNKPITKLEEEARESMEYALNWIENMKDKYNNLDIHFVFLVILD
jgi:hypothetical protein